MLRYTLTQGYVVDKLEEGCEKYARTQRDKKILYCRRNDH